MMVGYRHSRKWLHLSCFVIVLLLLQSCSVDGSTEQHHHATAARTARTSSLGTTTTTTAVDTSKTSTSNLYDEKHENATTATKTTGATATTVNSSMNTFTQENNSTNNTNVTTTAKEGEVAEEASIPEWKRNLPSPLNEKTNTLQRIIVPGPGRNGAVVEIYLMGTAHISNDSSRDVRLLLDVIDPSIIFLELCDARLPMIVPPNPNPYPYPNPPTFLTSDTDVSATSTTDEEEKEEEITKPTTTTTTTVHRRPFWRRLLPGRAGSNPPAGPSHHHDDDDNVNNEQKRGYGVAAKLLTKMQQGYAESLGVELGGEFRVAYEYWDEHHLYDDDDDDDDDNGRSVHMILGDRPLHITLMRSWQSLNLFKKIKFLLALWMSTLQKPDPDEIKKWMESVLSGDTDLLSESIAELAKHYPTLEETIIRERDAYMACKLYQTCREAMSMMNHPLPSTTSNDGRQQQHRQRYRIVAIVGAGHVEGICNWLTKKGSSSPSSNVNDNRTPEEILRDLIQLKKNPLSEEEASILIHGVMEVNYDSMQSMIADQQKQQQQQ